MADADPPDRKSAPQAQTAYDAAPGGQAGTRRYGRRLRDSVKGQELMAGTPESTDEKVLTYLKRLTSDLRGTKERLRTAEAREHEPIAIIGMDGLPTARRALHPLGRDPVEAASRGELNKSIPAVVVYRSLPRVTGRALSRCWVCGSPMACRGMVGPVLSPWWKDRRCL
ncbi:polyketide synthase docking domain-containing protein [Streptomyces sp. TG1A-8]|uniref:polyketide synthase docking domain-containing protein n=1 Tax=Streptomyces sp. TG1A-8 TaxID=3051385 RepID=UPI003463991F